ncbi:hypothetical protein [Nocardia sp. CNY236]|uniref:hypothetical protein n=1 Tax=Nocardia sp. CNY236 TaxID=1169152 RepID=UPI00041EEE06|nr:hypothetical protein [Nocardia sp. CNY236]
MNIDQNLSELLANGADVDIPVPDTATPMVSRSLRLPADLYEQLHALAAERGIGATTLMREILAAGVASADNTAVVPLADVQRAIASLAHPA